MPIFPLRLEKTYFEKGFFNVTVDFDKYVRPTNGQIELLLIANGRQHRVDGSVNRNANRNHTARIMGTTKLRDWFMTYFAIGAQVDVHLLSPHLMRLEKRP